MGVVGASPATPEEIEDDPPQRVRAHRRWVAGAAEAATAVGFALIPPALARLIQVDPLVRVGQVSALAAIQFQFALVAGGLVVALLLAQWWLGPGRRDLVTRFGCAAGAGLATGVISAGVVVALRGTPWGLWAGRDDYHILVQWAYLLRDGHAIPTFYPPMIVAMMAGLSRLTGRAPEYTLQNIQIVGTALFGPAAYLCWRLVLRPGWALGIGVVATIPFVEPLKPYPQLALVMLIPVVVALLSRLRRVGELGWARAAAVGAAHGAGLGLLFLLYSGWFVWAAPGVLVAAVGLAPWRAQAGRALVLAGAALAAFVLVAGVHLQGLFGARGGVSDSYFYFDTNVQPTYIAMWANDRPGALGPIWPPLGELGGVGVFTLLLAIGLAVALWLGWRRSAVVTIVSIAGGAWLVRMWLASQMFESHLVRLYPRTTMVLLYCLLLLTGLGVMYAFAAVRARAASAPPRAAPVGLALVPLLFLFASTGAATADKYMPSDKISTYGYFAWLAQTSRLLDGGCPVYAEAHGLCDSHR